MTKIQIGNPFAQLPSLDGTILENAQRGYQSNSCITQQAKEQILKQEPFSTAVEKAQKLFDEMGPHATSHFERSQQKIFQHGSDNLDGSKISLAQKEFGKSLDRTIAEMINS